MGKVATRYLEVDLWAIIEKDFHPEHNRVSESIFSLGNEYMGIRGYHEEGYSGDTLQGCYFNGIWSEIPITTPPFAEPSSLVIARAVTSVAAVNCFACSKAF